MPKWVRENPNLLSASAFLVGSVVFAIGSFLEWQAGPSQYLMLSWLIHVPTHVVDGLFALLFLALGLTKLWQWRQHRLRM